MPVQQFTYLQLYWKYPSIQTQKHFLCYSMGREAWGLSILFHVRSARWQMVLLIRPDSNLMWYYSIDLNEVTCHLTLQLVIISIWPSAHLSVEVWNPLCSSSSSTSFDHAHHILTTDQKICYIGFILKICWHFLVINELSYHLHDICLFIPKLWIGIMS